MCNENNCYVKGSSCPPECAERKEELLFKDVCGLYRKLLFKIKKTGLEDGFCIAYKVGNYRIAIELYNQIKEKLND